MPRVFEGKLSAQGMRFAVVAARFNSFITERLLAGALDVIHRHGGDPDGVDVAWVPGGFELPLAVKAVAETGRYDAVIALGCVIRGATPHFDYVASEVSKGLAHVGLDAGLPVAFGVLTTDSIEQAIERAGTKAGNKGADAALAAIEMVDLLRAVRA